MSAAPDAAVNPFSRTQANGWAVSDPASSAWVVANAGSGKTYVLAQRVMRLLLSGADPASILCLTFTKVAAAEMAKRVFGELGRWTILPDAELAPLIAATSGCRPDAATLAAARRLFARALETPGGLKIQTIHAFCEALLHQFPLEANVPGQFAILDENAAAALIAEARADMLAEAAAGYDSADDASDSRLAEAVTLLAERCSDVEIGKALGAVIDRREKLRRWFQAATPVGWNRVEPGRGVEAAVADLRRRLGLAPGEDEAAIHRTICAAAGWMQVDCGDLIAGIEGLADANTWDRNAAAHLKSLAAVGSPLAEAQARLAFFLTGKVSDGFRPHGQRISKALAAAVPGLKQRFAAEAERLIPLVERYHAARAVAATEALLVAGGAILDRYAAAKRRAGLLDFGDLIARSLDLLSSGDAAQWVLFKLDARIDHILVDEAQDTSPEQWALVAALADDFFSGENRAAAGDPRPRTIFAVGDDKQSIFSFQGGAPEMLAERGRFFGRLATESGSGFADRPLFLSFRSTKEVLDAVDAVFGAALAPRITAARYERHEARRRDEPGRVVILPRIVRESAPAAEDWIVPPRAPAAAEVAVAEQVVGEIGRLIGTALPSGRIVAPGDVLILIRRRGALAVAVNRALRDAGIVTAGADRVPVADHIAVLDLLALADAVLLPQDDLQLAACLKSPLFGLSEDDLARLADRPGRMALYRRLMTLDEEPFAAAAATLRRWAAFADQATPFRWFATILGPDGGRRAFRARLGSEADEVLDAFLSRALAYEDAEPPSLTGFLAHLRAGAGAVRRDPDAVAPGVRVMTAHGAKGLEAPVVFLLDDGSAPVIVQHRDTLVELDDGAFLWRRTKEEAPPAQIAADALSDAERGAEYLRLLYVGMTRAKDVLYVGGIRPTREGEEPRWYDLVGTALLPADAERDPETAELVAPFRWPAAARADLPPAAPDAPRPAPVEAEPAWLRRPAPPPPAAPRPLRPSRAFGEPDPPRNPADPDASAIVPPAGTPPPLLRGRLVHRLLEIAPSLPAGDRSRLLRRVAEREAGTAALEPLDTILAEVEAVLAMPDLQPFFGPGSRGEVPIVGEIALPTGLFAVSGRIDRLVRDASGWRLLDYKTARRIPATLAETDPAALAQIALYARLLADLEPDASVSATLVWTACPAAFTIGSAELAAFLPGGRLKG